MGAMVTHSLAFEATRRVTLREAQCVVVRRQRVCQRCPLTHMGDTAWGLCDTFHSFRVVHSRSRLLYCSKNMTLGHPLYVESFSTLHGCIIAIARTEPRVPIAKLTGFDCSLCSGVLYQPPKCTAHFCLHPQWMHSVSWRTPRLGSAILTRPLATGFLAE
jgi:hypothetical protein